jgi:hypothetical protein
MEEELVAFTTAKLAQEKGFNFIDVNAYYHINTYMNFKPNIKKWDFLPIDMSMNGKEFVKYYNEYFKINEERRFDTYEEALEKGLQEALELIKS